MNQTTIVLQENWKFHLGDLEDAWYAGYDDSGFQTVSVPHDWSVQGPFQKENSSGTGYVRGGIGWYRLHFSLDEAYAGKKIRILFDGVYKNAQVWINSYHLGGRPYGYSEFDWDVSALLHFGEEENVLCVQVTHTDLADSRWFTGSGIYRKVSLIVEDVIRPVFRGTVIKTPMITEEQAQVQISHEVLFPERFDCSDKIGAAEAELKVCFALYDAADQLTECAEATLSEEEAEQCRPVDPLEFPTEYCWKTGASLLVKHPILWDTKQPYLYTLKVFYTYAGETWVAETLPIGIRSIRFDADTGFYLNEKPMKLKGVCVHHDAGCLGSAVTPEIWQRRLEYLREAGCNAIRCSHNPHMPELYDLCDRMGFLVMDEAFDEWENPKNKWSTGHNVYPPKHMGYAEHFPEWHEKDLRTMVRRDRNHPSVILWSIGNEIDYPNDPYCHPSFAAMTGNNDANKPAAERQYDKTKPNAERLIPLAKHLSAIVRSEDDSRPVTMALAFPELSVPLGILDALDVAGYNYKEHLYETSHINYPKIPFLGSENGHHQQAWEAVRDHDFISGQFLWTGIDYLGEAHGWPIHGAGAGFLNLAGFRKENFYETAEYWIDREEMRPKKERTSQKEAESIGIQVWQGKTAQDLIRGESFTDASEKPGYIYQLEISLLDAEGVRTVAREQEIRVSVSGGGCLAGIENGDLADVTSYTDNYRKTQDGRLLIYIKRGEKKKISVSFATKDLKNSIVL